MTKYIENPSKFNIRLATHDDLDICTEFWFLLMTYQKTLNMGFNFPLQESQKAIWKRTYDRTLNKTRFLWVAEDSENPTTIVGFISAGIKSVPPYYGGAIIGELFDMWIVDEARRFHLGTAFMKIAQRKLFELDVHSIEIQVMAFNERALAFHKTLGYQPEINQQRLFKENMVD